MDWPYNELSNAAVFTSRNVVNRDAPVVRLIRDADGDWQALDAAPRAEGDGVVIALSALLDLYPEVAEAVSLLDARGPGWQAVRESDADWKLSPFD
jgi:hypothetical protein